MKLIFKTTMIASAVALVACSSLESDTVNYRSTAKAPTLSIPPDLTQLSKESRYTVVDGAVSASGFKAPAAQAPQAPIGATALGDVRIERAGNQRWLVVKRPSAKIWETVKEFWIENGFVLAIEQSQIGIMETDWAENRAQLSQGLIRSYLNKIFDSLSSTPERDKYRTRLESNAEGETEIYISHRGMYEIYTQERSDQTMWQPRPENPELETEFLRRLMVKLGASPAQAQTQLASPSAQRNTEATTVNGQYVVLLDDSFDRAWRRVGLSLDRSGFTVEDRDRKKGLYYVRYVPQTAKDTAEPGFFAKLFGSSTPPAPSSNKFMISVQSQGEKTTVSVLNEQGAVDTSKTAKNIADVIAQDLK